MRSYSVEMAVRKLLLKKIIAIHRIKKERQALVPILRGQFYQSLPFYSKNFLENFDYLVELGTNFHQKLFQHSWTWTLVDRSILFVTYGRN
jgi:hypothetical protein